MTKIYMAVALSLLVGGAALVAAQTEPVAAAPDAAAGSGMVAQTAGFGVGLVARYAEREDPASGKFVEKMRSYARFGPYYSKEDSIEIPIYLKGFLANYKTIKLAEIEKDQLQKLSDEFGMSEEGLTKFRTAKQAGQWLDVDAFVRGSFVLNKYNVHEIQAEVSRADDGKIYTATVARLQYDSPLRIARQLAENVEAICHAATPEERDLLARIQQVKAKGDAAKQMPEVNMIVLSATGAGLLAGTLAILNGNYGTATVSLLYGAGGLTTWFLQRSVAGTERKEYARLTAEYDQKYGARFTD